MKPSSKFVPLAWPLLALIAIAIIWTAVDSRNTMERSDAQRTALRDATSYAEAYAQYLARSVSQMDHVTMQLKYDWERAHGAFRFEDVVREGMFSDSAYVSVSIYDRAGKLLTSTRTARAAPSVAQSDYFVFHKNNISTALRITLPADEKQARQVRFSRRLDSGEDVFDGMIDMVIDADYFTTFYNRLSLGTEGFVAMVAKDGVTQVAKFGPAVSSGNAVLRNRLLVAPSGDGAGLRPASGFRDSLPRIVAWHRSREYPLIAEVGISQAEAIGAIVQAHHDRQVSAAIGSGGLLVFALIATCLSYRLALRQEEKEAIRSAYRTATDHANDGFYMLSPVRDRADNIVDFDIVDCNERGVSFYCMSRLAMIGMRLSQLPSVRAAPETMGKYIDTLRLGHLEEDVQMPADRGIQIEWARRTIVRSGAGLAVTLHDISRQKSYERQLRRLANEDTLIGLPNRYWLLNHLPTALEQAARSGTVLALLFIDLDGFKHVNDSQGHAVGDELLKIAAQRLAGLLRTSDHVVRFGGDEFIVVLGPVELPEQTAQVAQRVLDAFVVPFEINDETQSVGTSVGISMFPRDGTDALTLIKHADIAMYSGKSEGKGQFRFYQPLLYERIRGKQRSKQDLVNALERDELVLHFQPRVDTVTGELRSMEALVRWLHPHRGLVPPLEFIPLAESSGLIGRLGEIVMQKAAQQIVHWRDAGLPLVPVSINVSPLQFSLGNVHNQLAECLARWNVPAVLLEVEITESAMMGDQAQVLAELSSIRELGITLHIDDFGTGYSSLSQLQKLKMDVLKVDRAFTLELGNSKDGKIFFQAIVSMAHALGMTVVAEGVETSEQLEILQSLSCDEVQGYLVSKPVPAAAMAELMTRRFLFSEADIVA